MAERVIVTKEPVVVVDETVVDENLIYICARCELEIAGEPVHYKGEVYCCQGCALGTGCTCP